MKGVRGRHYRLYLDESGDHQMKNLNSVQKRYLGLTGVILPLALDDMLFQVALENFKSKFWECHPDDPAILHREDIMKKSGFFRNLQNPETCLLFDNGLLDLLHACHYVVITVVIDKQKQVDVYGQRAYDSYHFAVTLMLERFCGWLNYYQAFGDVYAERRGAKQDTKLKKEFNRVMEEGTDYLNVNSIDLVMSSKKLTLKAKEANVAGLQLADIIANPAKREILIEQGIVEPRQTAFEFALCEAITPKYITNSILEIYLDMGRYSRTSHKTQRPRIATPVRR